MKSEGWICVDVPTIELTQQNLPIAPRTLHLFRRFEQSYERAIKPQNFKNMRQVGGALLAQILSCYRRPPK